MKGEIENDFKKKIQKVCALLKRVTGGIAMNGKIRKKNEVTIVNKFKENEIVDIKELLENAFKIYYNMQITKNKVS